MNWLQITQMLFLSLKKRHLQLSVAKISSLVGGQLTDFTIG